jgi:hypothetical protein
MVTMMEVTVVTMKAGDMLLVIMKAGGRIKHIKMETQPVSGMDINGSVTSLLVFMVTDSWSLSQTAGNKKIDGQDKGAVVKKAAALNPSIFDPRA